MQACAQSEQAIAAAARTVRAHSFPASTCMPVIPTFWHICIALTGEDPAQNGISGLCCPSGTMVFEKTHLGFAARFVIAMLFFLHWICFRRSWRCGRVCHVRSKATAPGHVDRMTIGVTVNAYVTPVPSFTVPHHLPNNGQGGRGRGYPVPLQGSPPRHHRFCSRDGRPGEHVVGFLLRIPLAHPSRSESSGYAASPWMIRFTLLCAAFVSLHFLLHHHHHHQHHLLLLFPVI